jgi:hypothetical protein
LRGEVAQQSVLLLDRRAIDDIVGFRQHGQEPGDLLRRVLEIVVERNDHLALRRADPAEEGVVLPEVADQVDGPQPGLGCCELTDALPARVGAAVVDQDDLGREVDLGQVLRQRGM